MNPKQGGPCQGIRNAIPKMAEMGIVNEVVSFDNPQADFIKDDSFQIHALGESKTPWKYNDKLVPWLENNLSSYDFIIIHALWLYHSQASVNTIIEFRRKHHKGPKVFVMPHGMLDPYFQRAKERRIKALRNRLYWKFFENDVVNKADGVLFTCEEELLLARTTFPNYKPHSEINVGYGIQEPPKYSEEMKIEFKSKVPKWNGKPFLLFLSRIHPKKGIDLLINAYCQLEKKHSHLPQLIIAGPNESKYANDMMKLAQPSDNIIFAGMLGGLAKWGAFYESEVFILPSHQENFGIAVVESLACAIPVLISDKVNIWREIQKGKGGIVSNDNYKETYEMIDQWLNLSLKEKKEMKKNAYQVFSDHFTITRAAQNFINQIENA